MAETSTPTYTTRHATESDIPNVLQLIKDLAIYENALDKVHATESTLLSSLTFATNPTAGFAKALLIFSSDQTPTATTTPAGMAVYFFNYSTWTAAPGIYLEDLFVAEAHRGKGYGKALLQALARECLVRGCKRLDWSVLDWNQPSIDFYQSDVVGAYTMKEWVRMRVDGEALGKLAGRASGW